MTIEKNDIVILQDLNRTPVRVLEVYTTPEDVHKYRGNLKIQYLFGPRKEESLYVMAGVVNKLTHDFYQKMREFFTQRLAVLDEAMCVLHHDTRMESVK